MLVPHLDSIEHLADLLQAGHTGLDHVAQGLDRSRLGYAAKKLKAEQARNDQIANPAPNMEKHR
jgi:hypothetical protein